MGRAVKSPGRARAATAGGSDRGARVARLLHDLKTPLNTLKLSAGLLAREGSRVPDDLRESTARAASAVREIADLIETLTEAVQGHTPDPRRQRVELTTVCRRVVSDLRALYPERRIHLEAPHPVIGHWVPQEVLRVLQNLIGNALEHGRGDVEVEVTGDRGGALLRVRNQGPPVPPEVQARLRFAGAGEPGDRGLGLRIVKEAVQLHGGTLRCRSDDRESVFEVRLPSPGLGST